MLRVIIVICAIACGGSAFAQANFPSRPIAMVVGFAPGGGTDTVARIIAKRLAENIGQQVVVDNKSGAGGTIAVDHVAKAAPDGHTIVLANVGALAVWPHLRSALPYDPLRDLVPITMAVVFANVIVVHAAVPVKTLAEFVQLARDKPGYITYGSSGVAGAGHLAGELLAIEAKIDIVHVPYKGGGPAMQGLLGEQTIAMIATPVSAGPHVKAGKIRAIATTGLKRAKHMPDVPTIAESGYPGFEAMNWYAYFAPAKTPKEIIDRLHTEIVKSLAAPEVKDGLDKQGLEPSPSSSQELAQYLKREYDTWGKVVKQRGIKAQ
jgi:tripartite-type tricarboxylate transporter receptor subunit TctC